MNEENQGINLFSFSAEATEKIDQQSSNNRTTAYTVPCSEHVEHPTRANPYGSVNTIGQLRYEPVQCTCPYCHSIITTRLSRRSGVLVWSICFILILFGCWLGCCLIPFCISDLQNVRHFCPNCRRCLGEYRPL